VEFKQWLEVCGDAAYYLQEDNKRDFHIAVTDLSSSAWNWTRDAIGDRTLAEYIEATVREKATRWMSDEVVAKTVKEALTVLVNIVQNAKQEVYRVNGSPLVRRYLQPHHAVSQAASEALEKVR
jgi:GTPase Era involved in 16S rRNA processing